MRVLAEALGLQPHTFTLPGKDAGCLWAQRLPAPCVFHPQAAPSHSRGDTSVPGWGYSLLCTSYCLSQSPPLPAHTEALIDLTASINSMLECWGQLWRPCPGSLVGRTSWRNSTVRWWAGCVCRSSARATEVERVPRSPWQFARRSVLSVQARSGRWGAAAAQRASGLPCTFTVVWVRAHSLPSVSRAWSVVSPVQAGAGSLGSMHMRSTPEDVGILQRQMHLWVGSHSCPSWSTVPASWCVLTWLPAAMVAAIHADRKRAWERRKLSLFPGLLSLWGKETGSGSAWRRWTRL